MTPYFYHGTIRAVTVALSDIFNEIYIGIYDTSGTFVKTKKVSFKYGPVDKVSQIRTEAYSQEGGTKYYTQLPNIALTLTGLNRSDDRSTSVNEFRSFRDNDEVCESNNFMTDAQPTPIDFKFSLEYKTSTMNDFAQITEQTLVYFNPDLILRIREFEDFGNIERDLAVKLENFGINYDDNPYDEQHRRTIVGKIDFTVEGYLYFPRSTHSAIIKQIHNTYWIY